MHAGVRQLWLTGKSHPECDSSPIHWDVGLAVFEGPHLLGPEARCQGVSLFSFSLALLRLLWQKAMFLFLPLGQLRSDTTRIQIAHICWTWRGCLQPHIIRKAAKRDPCSFISESGPLFPGFCPILIFFLSFPNILCVYFAIDPLKGAWKLISLPYAQACAWQR